MIRSGGRIEDRVALTTGAGRGLGLGIARTLAGAGFKVAVTDIDAQNAERAAAELRSLGVDAFSSRLDVADSTEWKATVAAVEKRWGRLDVLVNNAGISPRGTVESTDEALWDAVMAINVKGAWLGMKTALPLLKIAHGHIINIGSNLSTRPARGMCAYCSSKAALLGLTRQAALDLLDDEVRCMLIAPGWVDTPGEREIQARAGRPDWPRGLRNITDPEQVGDAVVFLVSPAGRRLNGSILYLDSGQHIVDDVKRIYNLNEEF
jgi:meso-butanediol dehydrogenase/(S,S)-butanediol dehydrogenase/diacetyl reductase